MRSFGAGRWLQLSGGLALVACPFFPWAEVKFLGNDVGVPGIFLHGSVLLAVGLMVITSILVRARIPGFHLLLSLLAAGVGVWDLRTVISRTEKVMDKMQAWLADINAFMTKFRLGSIDLFERSASPWDYAATGVVVGFAGALLLALGSLLEAYTESGQARGFAGVLLGQPRCRECGFRFGLKMDFCPGCGAASAGAPLVCTRCSKPLEQDYRFCPGCRLEVSQAG